MTTSRDIIGLSPERYITRTEVWSRTQGKGRSKITQNVVLDVDFHDTIEVSYALFTEMIGEMGWSHNPDHPNDTTEKSR